MNEKDLASQLERVEQTIKRLEERLVRIERSSHTHAPTIPTVDWSKCPKCGIKLDTMMGYVCSVPQCPTGLGGVWCSAT